MYQKMLSRNCELKELSISFDGDEFSKFMPVEVSRRTWFITVTDVGLRNSNDG